MKSFLPNDIKDENRKIIFDILLQHPELAKVELAEKTAMSFVTVSKIVGFFEQIGLLAATGESRDGSSGLGRKRTLYRFDENSYTTIGIQSIGESVTALLVNLKGRVLEVYTIDRPVPFYSEAFTSVVEEIVSYMKEKAKAAGSRIIGIGIGVDGAINTRNQTIRIRTEGEREEDFHYEALIGVLGSAAGLPVLIENDVNASILAEFRKLELEDEASADLIHISAGEGIGAGIIINKELHRGGSARAGELEYMCFDPEFRKSPSSVGWLESKLGLKRLLALYDLSNADSTEACVDYVAKHLALVVTNMVSLLDINRVVMSGATIDLFPERMLDRIAHYVEQYIEWSPTITVSQAQHTAAMGAAILILQQEMMRVLSA
ncbi:ROK family protein [Paenibacillus sp. LHD-117]|uniref:ROK family protein n=1 Tax=Paenibacillus sp. LHD-117 TaxID=3071412 RepID=UPI0027E19242|nr:ROK family protein [Paenibacillus sp. LHD-117]MDQ6421472.1 ROK family protein [Paenibacillus sp. LHD-117]